MHKVIAALQGKLSQRDLDYLLEHGQEFRGRKLPAGIRRHPAGTCLDAADTLERQGHGRYVRGFGLLFRSKTPLMHAWVSKDGWHAVDPVWPDPELCSYWGMSGRRHETRLAAMSASIRKAPIFSVPVLACG
ncbi:hypothetical protein ASF33_14745 [Methylobacterium sp. Leaf92]|nr:hypothetical protein ASF33_14745 [Methylobacterium sp. Leaf92]